MGDRLGTRIVRSSRVFPNPAGTDGIDSSYKMFSGLGLTSVDMVIFFGSIEPSIREGLLSALPRDVEIRESPGRSLEVISEAIAAAARAVFLRLEEVEELSDPLPPGLVVIGVSTSRRTVLVRKGADRRMLRNPDPESLVELIGESNR